MLWDEHADTQFRNTFLCCCATSFQRFYVATLQCGSCSAVAQCFDVCGLIHLPDCDRFGGRQTRNLSLDGLQIKLEERAALPSARRAREASPGGREGEVGCSVTLLVVQRRHAGRRRHLVLCIRLRTSILSPMYILTGCYESRMPCKLNDDRIMTDDQFAHRNSERHSENFLLGSQFRDGPDRLVVKFVNDLLERTLNIGGQNIHLRDSDQGFTIRVSQSDTVLHEDTYPGFYRDPVLEVFAELAGSDLAQATKGFQGSFVAEWKGNLFRIGLTFSTPIQGNVLMVELAPMGALDR